MSRDGVKSGMASIPPLSSGPHTRASRAPWHRLPGGRALLLSAALMLSAALALGFAGLSPANAQDQPRAGAVRVDNLEAELVADVAAIVPGRPFRLGLRLAHDPHWHTYWRNPGDSGLPTQFDPTGPQGTRFDDIAWPAPERIAVGPLANYGYEGEVILARETTLPASHPPTNARFQVLAQWLVCKDVCIPGEASLALTLPVRAAGAPAEPGPFAAAFDRHASRVPDARRPLGARAWQGDGRFGLMLDETRNVGTAEFFPYFEGVVRPAAPQALSLSREAPARPVLVTELVDGAAGFDAASSPAGGLLVLDGKPFEVRLARVAQAPLYGDAISVAALAAEAPGGAKAGGLLAAAGSGGPGGSTLGAAGGSAGAKVGSQLGSQVGSQVIAQADSPRAARPPAAATGAAQASGTATTLVFALVGAVLGGLLLNLMPCVFPVIGLKVMSFAGGGGASPGHARRQALAFSAGVVLSFLLLGALLLALRAAGEVVGWGFQMQSPVFVSAMALLFLMIGLNLFGVFEVGTSLTTIQTSGDGAASNFWTGVVAVLVATPCTAPFMGSAVGFTLTSPAPQTLAIFVALGVGMALPYLLFGFVPALIRWLPRPGPWLETFKQLMGFPMLATASWLVWVLALQAGADGVLHLLLAGIALAFGGWLLGRQQRRGRGLGPRAAPWRFALAMVSLVLAVWQVVAVDRSAAVDLAAGGTGAAGTVAAVPAPRAAGWQPWSSAAVEAALAAGRPVFVDFTAAWCISCQANKKLVLERDAVLDAFTQRHAVLLRADWTRRDPSITRELARHGRNGVPLYLWIPRAGEVPVVLPELLTIDTVLAALGARD
ncbi:MAG: protein-disulfide reductase DsbD family protein [Lautropia sp.]